MSKVPRTQTPGVGTNSDATQTATPAPIVGERSSASDRDLLPSRSDLDSHGRFAFDVAIAQVDAMPDSDRFFHAVLRFARAVQMTEKIRREWILEGEPLTYTHHNGAIVPHPLVKMLADTEKEAMRAGRALKLEPDAIKGARGGSAPGRQSAPDRKAPPLVTVNPNIGKL